MLLTKLTVTTTTTTTSSTTTTTTTTERWLVVVVVVVMVTVMVMVVDEERHSDLFESLGDPNASLQTVMTIRLVRRLVVFVVGGCRAGDSPTCRVTRGYRDRMNR